MPSCAKCGTNIKTGFLGNSVKVGKANYCKSCSQSAKFDVLREKTDSSARQLFDNLRKLFEVDFKEVPNNLSNYEIIDLTLNLIKSHKKLDNTYELVNKIKLESCSKLHAKLKKHFPSANLDEEIPLVWFCGIIQGSFLLTNFWLHLSTDKNKHLKIPIATADQIDFKTKFLGLTNISVDGNPLGAIDLGSNKKVFVKFFQELFTKKSACKDLVSQEASLLSSNESKRKKRLQERNRKAKKSQQEKEQKLKALQGKYGETDGEKVFKGEVFQGMSKEMLVDVIGPPQKTNSNVYKTKTKESYFYHSYETSRGTTKYRTEIKIENEQVVGWNADEGSPLLNQKNRNNLGNEYDENWDEALAIVAETKMASISLLQKRLRIGYNRAAKIIEKMEEEGIVGPSDGSSGPRDVFID